MMAQSFPVPVCSVFEVARAIGLVALALVLLYVLWLAVEGLVRCARTRDGNYPSTVRDTPLVLVAIVPLLYAGVVMCLLSFGGCVLRNKWFFRVCFGAVMGFAAYGAFLTFRMIAQNGL